jgi:hypothetical protein
VDIVATIAAILDVTDELVTMSDAIVVAIPGAA